MNIRENIPIKDLTTMRLGGPARYLVAVENAADVQQAYAFADEKQLPVFVLGSGSNVIGRDEGFSGVLILNQIITPITEEKIDDSTSLLSAGSGVILDDFIAHVTKLGFTGMEAMSKVPGTLGAAPVQNVGAYGQDISQVLESVEVFDTETKETKIIAAADCNFTYRHSIFNQAPDAGRYFITMVSVRLKKGSLKAPFYNSLQAYLDQRNILDPTPQDIRDAVSAIRAEKLPDPDVAPSAGSFFQNVYLSSPEDIASAKEKGIPVWDGGKIPGAWLLENSGVKGKVFHGFEVWDKAPLVLVNKSAETFSDLEQARQEILNIVENKFGFTLSQEPVILG